MTLGCVHVFCPHGEWIPPNKLFTPGEDLSTRQIESKLENPSQNLNGETDFTQENF